MPQHRRPRAPAWSELAAGGSLAHVAALCFGVWLHAADAMLVATVLPSAVDEIGGVALVNWTIALYLLGSIVAGSASGLLALRLGLRTAMSGAALVYAFGCAIGAVAPTMPVLLAGRVLQGAGGGAMVALALVAVGELFPRALWPRVMAVLSAVWGASAFCGPLVGGAFATWGLWRGAFWAFAAQAVVLAGVVALLLGRSARPPAVARPTLPVTRLAVLGGAVLAIAAAGIDVALVRSSALVALGVALLALVLRLDARRPASRLFPSRPLDLAHAGGAGTAMILALTVATISLTVYGPLVMVVRHGATPLQAGYMIALESIGWTIAAVTFSGVGAHREGAVIRAGAVTIATAVCGLAVAMPRGPLLAIAPWAALEGAGFGMAWGFVTRRIVSGVPDAEKERAAASIPTAQHIGYAIGSALCGIVANATGFATGATRASAGPVGFWIFAAFAPLAALGVAAAWRLGDTRFAPDAHDALR